MSKSIATLRDEISRLIRYKEDIHGRKALEIEHNLQTLTKIKHLESMLENSDQQIKELQKSIKLLQENNYNGEV